MIAFTVMDHDVLTANDFAGEAFLALGNIPGVADYSTSIENFHGLKQVDLPLMQQNDKSKLNTVYILLVWLNAHVNSQPNDSFPFQIIRFCKFWSHAPAINRLWILCVSRKRVLQLNFI